MSGSEDRLTVEELYGLPEDGRKWELQAGLLVSEPLPGARHGRVMATVAALLHDHVRSRALGAVYAGDTGFVLKRRPDTTRGPDVAFVSRGRLGAIVNAALAFPGAPDLAVEVLSPSNTAASMHAKVADYLAAGTRLVWVVDPESHTVSVYETLLEPRVLGPEDTLEGGAVVSGFAVRVAELFED